MPKRKRLGDLFQIGKEITIIEPSRDGDPDQETVWLQKLNSVELEQAWRRANAVRARLLAVKHDTDSDEYFVAVSDALEKDDDELVDYLLGPERAKSVIIREAELAADEEWSKDDYLQGLRDAWNDGLGKRFHQDNEDPDAKRVWMELRRFADGVDALMQSDIDDLRASFEALPVEEVRKQATELCFEQNATEAWAREYNYAEIWLGTRELDDHGKRYFVTREEVDQLAAPVLGRLQREFESMRVDVLEGKGSVETRDSSPSSEPAVEEETPDSSGLVAAST